MTPTQKPKFKVHAGRLRRGEFDLGVVFVYDNSDREFREIFLALSMGIFFITIGKMS